MKYRSVLAFSSLFILGVLVAAQEPVIDVSLSRQSVLGPGDEIAGRVVGESEYDFAAFVNEDGYVEVPFSAEPVLAKCRTERELRLDLIARLSKYLKNPQFSFRVMNRNSRPPTTISGEVNNPTQVVLMRKVTLFEMLTLGGGAKEDSAGGLVQVFRPQAPVCPGSDVASAWQASSSNPMEIPSRTYKLKDVTMGHEESNPYIYPGDVVVVQRAAPVWVTGEVISAQGIFLKDEGLSVMGAIAKVGGPKREAKLNDVRVRRLKPGTKDDYETISVDLVAVKKGLQKDLLLKPFDIVEVGQAKPGVAKTIMDIAIGAAKTTITAASGAIPYRVIY
jgi:protein involved in polysaccharide export with SLBB domain